MDVVIATRNAGKLAELRALLPDAWVLRTLDDVCLPSPDETGVTFEDNALLKARAAALPEFASLADDSGLEVDALGGAPGVFSARYSGPDATDDANNRLLVSQLDGMSGASRRARFVSVVVLVMPDGSELVATGMLLGTILEIPRGSGGFGYDPLFMIDDPDAGAYNGRTLAELTNYEKNQVSHRSRAYRALAASIVQGYE